MTRDEAIKTFEYYHRQHDRGLPIMVTDRDTMALDMAIESLKQPQIIRCEDCKHSYDDIGGTYCSYGVCVDCVVDIDFFCRYGERREEDESMESL